MADSRTVFTILEDNSTAEGVKLPARTEGATVGGNHVPSMVAKDASGNYKLIETRDAGAASSGVDSLPILPVKDLAGNLQYINARDAGDAVSGVDALPALIAKDSSGNFAYLPLNADGELIVSNDSLGVKKFDYAKVAPAAINTLTTIVDLTLTADAVYEDIFIRVSATHASMWELVQVDDATLTVLDSFVTGPGQFTFKCPYNHMEITAGSTGTQALRIRATQLQGSVTDHHAYVEAFEKA
jgi:hypothetical protein